MKYITTKAELEAVSVAALGPMTDRTFTEFHELAKATGVGWARLMLTWIYKPGMAPNGISEVVYPVQHYEWQRFLDDIKTYCVDTPLVYVVDGTQYTAGI